MESPYEFEEKPRRRRASLKLGGSRTRSTKRYLSKTSSIPTSPVRRKSLPPTPTEIESRFEKIYDRFYDGFTSTVTLPESRIMDTILETPRKVYNSSASVISTVAPNILAIPSFVFAVVNIVVFNILLSVILEICTSFVRKWTAPPGSLYATPPNVIPSPSFYSTSSKAFSVALSTELSVLFGTLLLSRRTKMVNRYVSDRVYDFMQLLWATSGVVTGWIFGLLFLIGTIALLAWLLLISGSPWIAIIVSEAMRLLRVSVMGLLKMSGAGWLATKAVETALGFMNLQVVQP